MPILSFGQKGGCEKILYDMGEILKNFAHLKNILCPPLPPAVYIMNAALAELKIATNMVANATNIFSLATKNSGLDATLATKFLYDLELNQISKVKTNISSYLALLSS